MENVLNNSIELNNNLEIEKEQKNFLENVISDADYKFLKAQLKADGYEDWYFVVWFMAATGARVASCCT